MLGKNLCDLNLYTRVLFRSMPFRSMDPCVYSAWNLLQTFMHESSSGCYYTITLQSNLALQPNLQKSLGLVLKSGSEKSGRSLGSLHFHMAGKRVDPRSPLYCVKIMGINRDSIWHLLYHNIHLDCG
jgi:hypothetical protein